MRVEYEVKRVKKVLDGGERRHKIAKQNVLFSLYEVCICSHYEESCETINFVVISAGLLMFVFLEGGFFNYRTLLWQVGDNACAGESNLDYRK